jgi:hypothetical protein
MFNEEAIAMADYEQAEVGAQRVRMIAYRAEVELVNATALAVAADGCSRSDVDRGSLIRDLRARGFLPPVVRSRMPWRAIASVLERARGLNEQEIPWPLTSSSPALAPIRPASGLQEPP